MKQEPLSNGKITVSIPNSWADIWIDDKKVGRTGQIDPIEVPPGEHVLRLENKYSQPHVQTFTISSGEERNIVVNSLKRKPSFVVFPDQYSGECGVFIDQQAAGTLTSLNYKLTISEPNIPHAISLQCPNKSELLAEIGQMSPGTTIPVPSMQSTMTP